MSEQDETKVDPVEEECSYCGITYPFPVSLHHDAEECRRNGRKQTPTEIWTPPEVLPTNVGRMAWALLMEEIRGFCTAKGSIADYPVDRFAKTYEHCIDVARILEDINQNPPKRAS